MASFISNLHFLLLTWLWPIDSINRGSTIARTKQVGGLTVEIDVCESCQKRVYLTEKVVTPQKRPQRVAWPACS